MILGESAVKDLISAIPSSKGRVEMLHLDVTSDDSVGKAAEDVAASGRKLFGIVNNAGIIGSYSDTLNVNYFGARRVNDAFKSVLISTGGRIVVRFRNVCEWFKYCRKVFSCLTIFLSLKYIFV